MTDARRENGFTLTETLVSLAILSLMATLLLGGVTMAAHIARNSRQVTETVDEVSAAQMILRDKILHLRPVARLTGGQGILDLRGTEQMFDFFAPAPMGGAGGAGNGGLQKYRLLLTSPGDLILYHVPDLTERADPNRYSITGWKPLVLLRGASSLSIGYFGAINGQPERKWRNFWYESGKPPELVRVRIGFPPEDRRSWSDLIVRPGPTVDISCDSSGVGGGSAKDCGKRK